MIVVVFKHRPKADVNLQEDEQFMTELYLLAKHILGFLRTGIPQSMGTVSILSTL